MESIHPPTRKSVVFRQASKSNKSEKATEESWGLVQNATADRWTLVAVFGDEFVSDFRIATLGGHLQPI